MLVAALSTNLGPSPNHLDTIKMSNVPNMLQYRQVPSPYLYVFFQVYIFTGLLYYIVYWKTKEAIDRHRPIGLKHLATLALEGSTATPLETVRTASKGRFSPMIRLRFSWPEFHGQEHQLVVFNLLKKSESVFVSDIIMKHLSCFILTLPCWNDLECKVVWKL